MMMISRFGAKMMGSGNYINDYDYDYVYVLCHRN
jgi:hypothetical protein